MSQTTNSTILVVGGNILTTGDFVFEARQEYINLVIDDFGPPILNFTAPIEIMEGERITITMSGNRTYNPLQIAVQGSGVTVDSANVDSDTQITATISVAADAMAERSHAGDGDTRDIQITTLPGQTDADGDSLEQSQVFANSLRVYFSAPSLSSASFSASGGIINQGDVVNLTLNGDRMYTKYWGASQQMSTTVSDGVEVATVVTQVTNRNLSVSQVHVQPNATRGPKTMKVNTYSGDSNDLAGAFEVFFSAPTITSALKTDDTAIGTLAAGSTTTIRIKGRRLEGVLEQASNIKVGQIVSGAFSQTGTDAAGDSIDLSSVLTITPGAAVYNESDDSAVTDWTGRNGNELEYVDFDLAVPQNISADLTGLAIQITTLSAAGSQQTAIDNVMAIDGADPAITAISVAGRAGDDKSTLTDAVARTVTVTGQNFYGDLNMVKLVDENTMLEVSSSASSAGGLTISNAQKNSDTEIQFDLAAADIDSLERTMVRVVVATDTGESPAPTASRIEILPEAPELDAFGAGQGITLDRPASGTATHSFTMSGDNLYNSLLNSGADNKATSGSFGGYFGAANKMTASLSNPSGLSNLRVHALSDGTIQGTVDVAHNAAASTQSAAGQGLHDLTIETRSGSFTLANAIDIIPSDPTLASLSVDEAMEGTTITTVMAGTGFFPTNQAAALAPEEIFFSHAFYTDRFNENAGVDSNDIAYKWNLGQSVAIRRVDLLNGTDGRDLAIQISGSNWQVAKIPEDVIAAQPWLVDGADDYSNYLSSLTNAITADNSLLTWVTHVENLSEGDMVALRLDPSAPAGQHDATAAVYDMLPSGGLAQVDVPLSATVFTPEEIALNDAAGFEANMASRKDDYQAYADGDQAAGDTLSADQYLRIAWDIFYAGAGDIRGNAPGDANAMTVALVDAGAGEHRSWNSDAAIDSQFANMSASASFDATQQAAFDQHKANSKQLVQDVADMRLPPNGNGSLDV